jgi:hypothetical protein
MFKQAQPEKHSSLLSSSALKTSNAIGSIECQLCIYVFELVDNQLKNNKTDDEIVAGLESICNLFLSDVKSQVNIKHKNIYKFKNIFL